MAFEKLSTSTTGGKAQIRFYEQIDNLFAEVKLLTSYRSRTIKDESGKSDFDEYAMTDSEEDFFLNALKYVVPETFGELAKIATGVQNSVFFETDSSTTDVVGFSLIDYEAYDNNILSVIDKRLRKCYIYYVIKEWWAHTAFDEIYQRYELLYREALREMKKKAWTLIKPLMTND